MLIADVSFGIAVLHLSILQSCRAKSRISSRIGLVSREDTCDQLGPSLQLFQRRIVGASVLGFVLTLLI